MNSETKPVNLLIPTSLQTVVIVASIDWRVKARLQGVTGWVNAKKRGREKSGLWRVGKKFGDDLAQSQRTLNIDYRERVTKNNWWNNFSQEKGWGGGVSSVK